MDSPSRKVVLLGESFVGKSSIALRFVKNVFFQYREATVAATQYSSVVNVNGKDIPLQIWDTAGQERFASLTPMYYRQAVGALLVYSIDNLQSFYRMQKWVEELKFNTPEVRIIVVGNKCDMEKRRKVLPESAEKYCRDNSLLFIETSAKEGTNINEAFKRLAEDILKFEESLQNSEQDQKDEGGKSNRVRVGKKDSKGGEKSGIPKTTACC